MASTYLSRTQGTQTLNTKFTISVWVKRAELSSSGMNAICGSSSSGSHATQFFFDGPSLRFYDNFSSTDLVTTRKFRDTNAWYHIVAAIDTSQSTAADRVKIYVNGTQETSFATSNYPNQGDAMILNISGYTFYVGTAENTGGTKFGYFDGCMSHFHFTDGYAYDASTFGSTDSTTGEWKINVSPSITMGNNGFTILKDANTITDQSSNSNNFTLGAGTLTNTKDCPDNVFCVYNKLNTDRTMANGNTTVTTTNANFYGASGTIGVSSGKYYWEVKLVTGTVQFVGVDYNPAESFRQNKSSNTAHSYLIYAGSGSIYNNSAITSYGSAYSQGDIVGVAMDLDNSKLYFRKNGDAWFNSGDPTSGSTGTGAFGLTAGETYFPVVGDGASGYGAVTSTNFGNGYFGTTAISSEGTNASNNGKFEYDVPTGYTALSTKGLNE